MKLDDNGMINDSKIIAKRFPRIEHGELKVVHAIVVHQTDSESIMGAFNSYLVIKPDTTGAHFLIDRDGTIFQTASLKKRCYHVGKYIKSKCLTLHQENCADAKKIMANIRAWTLQKELIDKLERSKNYPNRYPVNSDSIGIEIVGAALTSKTYEPLTMQQQASLKWLVTELGNLLQLSSDDVYRHPDVSYKNEGEAASAVWK